jgi:hypothetical protein
MTPIIVGMEPEDFQGLLDDQMYWAAEPDWDDQLGRFKLLEGTGDINREYRYIFWLGQQRCNLILARCYLDTIGRDYQILTDEHIGDYVLLTNYPTPSLLRPMTFQDFADVENLVPSGAERLRAIEDALDSAVHTLWIDPKPGLVLWATRDDKAEAPFVLKQWPADEAFDSLMDALSEIAVNANVSHEPGVWAELDQVNRVRSAIQQRRR